MLEKTRRKGASTLLYLVFGVLIATFVINFGPQSRGSEQGCSGAAGQTVLSVGDTNLNLNAYRIPFNFLRQGDRRQKMAFALDALTRREILAAEAETRGFRILDDVVDKELTAGWIHLRGNRIDAKGAFFAKVGDESYFDYDQFKSWVGSLGVSVGTFKAQQKREMLAAVMAQIIKGSARASRDEALSEFLYAGTTVTFDAVKFSAGAYRGAMKLSDADIERFLGNHDAEVAARFKENERLYKGVKPQVKVRSIFVAKRAMASPAAPAPAAPGADGEVPATTSTVEVTTDPGLTRLDAAREEILGKKRSFEAVAAELNDKEDDRANAGLLGWRTVETPQLGDPALAEALKLLAPGQVSAVVTSSKGFHLLTVEDKREGDLSYEQVKREIAMDLARDVWSGEAAKRAAIAALEAARADGGKNLDQLYEAGPQKPNMDIEQIINNPNISDEQKQQILEMLMQKSGAIEWESQDIPARWGEPEPRPGAVSAVPAGGGGDSPAATTSAGSAPAAPPAAGAPGDDIAASSDRLPTFAEVAKPKRQSIGPMPRTRGDIPGLGTSKELVSALFDELTVGMLATRIYKVSDDYVLVQLGDKATPNLDDFEKNAEKSVADFASVRGEQLLSQWLTSRCEALVTQDKIKPEESLLREEDEQGRRIQIPYTPCQNL